MFSGPANDESQIQGHWYCSWPARLIQSWKDGELRTGVSPARQGEVSKTDCQELRAVWHH